MGDGGSNVLLQSFQASQGGHAGFTAGQSGYKGGQSGALAGAAAAANFQQQQAYWRQQMASASTSTNSILAPPTSSRGLQQRGVTTSTAGTVRASSAQPAMRGGGLAHAATSSNSAQPRIPPGGAGTEGTQGDVQSLLMGGVAAAVLGATMMGAGPFGEEM
jgi:hypothetical protein